MKPYYRDDRTLLYCADNRDLLPYWAERSVDLVYTDPPFGEWTHLGARTNPVGGSGGRNTWDTPGNVPQPMIDFNSISAWDISNALDRLGYLARRWVLTHIDWRHYADMERNPPAFLRPVRLGVWDKPNGAPQFTGDRPGQGWEAIGIFHRMEHWREKVNGRRFAEGGRMSWNGGGHRAVWRFNKINDPFNPTAKPPELVMHLMELFSNPGDVVLDPFAGVGTTLLCARASDRYAIGIEKDEAQCAEIVRRLKPTFGQPVRQRQKTPALSALPMFESEAA
jgi:site-specific DNA-methyltransferase (adenine-specific)